MSRIPKELNVLLKDTSSAMFIMLCIQWQGNGSTLNVL